MTPAHRLHENILSALREKRFERLVIKKFEGTCYLIVHFEGKPHVFADHAGQKKEYQHVWQVHNWLKESFGISAEAAPVELIRS